MTDYFVQAFIYLVAAVIAVPLARRLGHLPRGLNHEVWACMHFVHGRRPIGIGRHSIHGVG